MTRVRNADEFWQLYQRLLADYRRVYKPLLDGLRDKYAGGGKNQIPPALDEALEFHTRTYVVNALLAALNWRLDAGVDFGLPNLAPEIAVESAERGTKRFLDYLGFEHATNRPLLLVETKRPSSLLPELADSANRPPHAEALAMGLRGEKLMAEWSDWLRTLTDYVVSLRRAALSIPLRVVITNGEWLIAFLDPFDAFVETRAPDPNRILVLKNQREIEEKRNDLFLQLEHQFVLGKGKELVARAIHNLSARRDRNFVSTNCAAIPAGLLESELFGHERGAFTGAVAREIGRFEMADKGSMFLDEVGDIPLELQSKLLRVVQEQEFERLGTARTIRVNFRLVAATNRDLLEMVETDRFRRDLYYRLNVFPITVPPLRDRLEDIPLLVRHFAKTYAERMNKAIDVVRPKDIEALIRYSWPGNVRELQNVIERCVILSSDRVLHPPEFPDANRVGKEASLKPRSLAEAEREHILQALRDTEWVIGGPHGAAAQLAVRRTTLLYKMRRLGISRPVIDESLSAG